MGAKSFSGTPEMQTTLVIKDIRACTLNNGTVNVILEQGDKSTNKLVLGTN